MGAEETLQITITSNDTKKKLKRTKQLQFDKKKGKVFRDNAILKFASPSLLKPVLLFGSNGGTFSGDGLKTGLNGLHRAGGMAGHALQEEEPGLLVEDGVGTAAGMTGHILLDVPASEMPSQSA